MAEGCGALPLIVDRRHAVQGNSLFRFLGWKLLKHLLDSLFKLLFILFWFAGNCVNRGSPPHQLVGFGVVHVQDERTNFVSHHSRRSVVSKSSPPPTWAQTGIEGLILLLSLGSSNSSQGDVRVGRNPSPSLGL